MCPGLVRAGFLPGPGNPRLEISATMASIPPMSSCFSKEAAEQDTWPGSLVP